MAEPPNPYIASLIEREDDVQPRIEALMDACHSRPVGKGYIDVITRQKYCDRFIAGATAIGVAIELITLWCDCSELNQARYGCPHGYGGPMHPTGYFSETCESDSFDVEKIGIDVRRSA